MVALSTDAAYGLRWRGLSGEGLAVFGAEGWPAASVGFTRTIDPGGEREFVDGDHAVIRTPAALLRVDRPGLRLEVCSPEPVPASDVIHPALWPAATVIARWWGRETLHAGAFSLDGASAWAVLGDRGAGKSSLLAALALEGIEVLADDLLVIDGGRCLAGPRCLDLRPATAAALGLEDRTTLVRSTERWRLPLSPGRASHSLAGFIYLDWGAEIALRELVPAERFRALIDHRRLVNLGADFDHLLDLSALPGLRLSRPPDWDRLGDVVRLVTEAAGGSALFPTRYSAAVV